MNDDDARIIALELAITAAHNATQAVAELWEMLTPDEQDRWLEDASTIWPRRDVALTTLLPAADKLLADLRVADE